MPHTQMNWTPPPLPDYMKEEPNSLSRTSSDWSPPPLPAYMREDEITTHSNFSILERLNYFWQLCLHIPQKNTHNFAIQIQGDNNFIKNTQKALRLIKTQSAKDYQMVEQYIGCIKQYEKSGMAAFWETPTFLVGDKTSNSTTHWYASCIVHDAYHSKLFHDALKKFGHVKKEVWTGKKAEMDCLDAQESFLKTSKAPKRHLKSIEKARTYDYWSDYKSRNW